ncbi:MAG: VOC family protein [Gammaproteobacteria bacterium]|nr:VOC family protein [Gammaproteobacteria bacterium]NNM12766.1 VOC family protein [Gammaproteobacteria bacterium]
MTPFHLALTVRDINEARDFYTQTLGCSMGRSDIDWVDLDFFGHQLTCHLDPELGKQGKVKQHINPVDGHGVPIPHCGVVLEMPVWRTLAESLKGKVAFIIEPYIRFPGEPGEQATMFFCDPSGNALEFKAFKNISKQLFAT